MNRKSIAILLFAAFVSACGHDGRTSEKPVFRVHAFTVETDTSNTVRQFPGRVKPSAEFMLSFKVTGRVQGVYVNEGDFVKKGQLIAEIDPKDYRDMLDAAQSKYDQISAEAGRVIRLYHESVVSANDYDKARYGLQTAASALELAKRQLEDCRLYAPMDGYIQTRYSEPSSIVATGLAVVNMVSAGTPLVEIEIPASVYSSIKKVVSSTARFSGTSIPPVSLSIEGIAPKANANQLYTLTFTMKDRSLTMLRPGMVAMVDVEFDDRGGSDGNSRIPSSALFNRNDSVLMWVLSEDNTVHSTPADVISFDSEGMAVISGVLPGGTRVVTAGVHKLREGEKVEAMAKVSPTNVGGIL